MDRRGKGRQANMSVPVLFTGTMVVLRNPETFVMPTSFPVSCVLITVVLPVPTTMRVGDRHGKNVHGDGSGLAEISPDEPCT